MRHLGGDASEAAPGLPATRPGAGCLPGSPRPQICYPSEGGGSGLGGGRQRTRGESVDDEDCRMVLASGRTSGITSGTDAEALRHADLNAADRLKCDLPDGLRG